MPRTERLIKALLLLLLIGALYAPALSYDFVYDDLPHITHNPQVTDPSISWFSIFFLPTHPGDLYRPLTTLTYRTTAALAGLDKGVFHATNILLHWICAVLIGEILWRLTRQCNAAFMTAVLFALHPVGVEAVASIVGRAEILAALFILTALCLELQQTPRTAALRTPLLTLPLLFCAMLSKESAFVGTLLVPATVYWDRQRSDTPSPHSGRQALILFALTLIPAALALALRVHALNGFAMIHCDATRVFPENPICHLALSERAFPALNVLAQYGLHAVAPFTLSADYSQTLPTLMSGVFSPVGILQTLLMPVLLVIAWIHRQAILGAGLLWFLSAFACTANVLFPIGTIMADRLAYLPLSGALASLCFFLVGAEPSVRWQRARTITTLLLLACFACAATGRVAVWKDSYTLFSSTIRDNPLSPKAHYNLAITLLLEERDTKGAEALLKESLRLNPHDSRTTRALAEIGIARNEPWHAEYWLRRTLELDPGDAKSEGTLEHLKRLKQLGTL